MNSIPKRYILLFIVSTFAFYIRFMGIRFGFPLLTHPDEPQLILRGLEILKTDDLNPHFFNYPSFYIYLQSMVYFIVQKLCVLLKFHVATENIPLTTMVFWGRFFTVCLSVATILVTYKVGAKLFNSKVGLISALFLSFSYLHITNSYLITVDSPMTFWVLLSFYLSILIYKKKILKHYMLGGLFVGFAVGTKYNAFFCAVPIFVAHIYSTGFNFKKLFDKKLIIAAIAAIFAFLISTPYSLLDFHSFIADLMYESSHYKIGHFGADQGNSYLFYITSIVDYFGVAQFLLSITGIVLMVRKDKGSITILSSFPFLYFIFVGYYKVHFERNIVVLIPFLSIFSGYAIWRLLGSLKNTAKQSITFFSKFLIVIVIFFAIAGLFFQTKKALKHILTITLPDTRYISSLWIKENLPENSKIVREHFTYLPPDRYFKDFPLGVSGLLFYDLFYFDYFIASGPNYLPLLNNQINFPKAADSYKKIFKENELIKEFLPDGKTLTGPKISIYRINQSINSNRKEEIQLQIKGIMEILKEVQKMTHVVINLSELYWSIGNLFYKYKELEIAIKHYQIALKIQPNQKKVIEKLGLIHAELKKYDMFLYYFNKLIFLEPENEKHYYNIACVLSLQKRIPESVKFLQLAINKGYSNFERIEKDEDLNNIKASARYKKLIQQFKPHNS
jgi:4-amino-4-deoxy-L-arabinose transferase-like glycosyltransferase